MSDPDFRSAAALALRDLKYWAYYTPGDAEDVRAAAGQSWEGAARDELSADLAVLGRTAGRWRAAWGDDW
jgi:hypothetical protein